jgi:GT2 family glycosyltransferase
MQVCGVIVTYGDRLHLLSQVIDGLLKERIDKIVIIDNGSSVNTQTGLNKYLANVILHRFDENKGTAIAFKTGIIKAIETGCEFIWLMDDDTVSVTGSLDHLKDFWSHLPENEKGKTIALCSYRQDRSNFVKAFVNNNPDEILPAKNNFAGFHIKNLVSKFRERINPGKKKPGEPAPGAVRISAASYGGLFFHKDLIKQIGLPEESYLLYVDDFDFTYRIARSGGKIWMVTNSIIHDLESSFYLPAKKNLLYHSAFDAIKDSSPYYALRNTVYFSKQFLVSNKFVYTLNRFLFLAFITVIGILRGKSKRLKLIRSAIKDGENGRLGFNPEYKI